MKGKRNMKKVLSVFLSILMFTLCILPYASAISIEEGTPMLDMQFKDGKSTNGIDYVYFSPVKKSGTTKYPLFIWLHGADDGLQRRAQLQGCELSNWASDEYQAKFINAGGCFIFAPRASISASKSWESSQVFFLKDAIDEFVKANEANIDTDRIYIAGHSSGAVMVWDMISAFQNYFAAAIPACAVSQPIATKLSRLKNTSVWIFCCDKDPYPLAKTVAATSTFIALGDITKRPDGVRMTSMSQAVFADYSKKTEWSGTEAKLSSDAEHYIWEAITHDMHMNDGSVYAYSKTVDAKGKTIDFSNGSGVISWLSAQKKAVNVIEEDDEPESTGSLDFWGTVNSLVHVILEKLADILETVFGIKIR